ncbi:MAG: glycosyl hydrolase family 28-related protein [Pseudomonadota bacterium]
MLVRLYVRHTRWVRRRTASAPSLLLALCLAAPAQALDRFVELCALYPDNPYLSERCPATLSKGYVADLTRSGGRLFIESTRPIDATHPLEIAVHKCSQNVLRSANTVYESCSEVPCLIGGQRAGQKNLCVSARHRFQGWDNPGVTTQSFATVPAKSCEVDYLGDKVESGSSATDNVVFSVPDRVIELNQQNSELFRSGFVDATWWNRADGLVVDKSGKKVSTGLQVAINEAHNYDLAVYLPPGKYLVDRTLELRRNINPGSTCSSSSSKSTVLYGDPKNKPKIILAKQPAVNFDDPDNPRPVVLMWAWTGRVCPGNGVTNVNDELLPSEGKNGFRQSIKNVIVDIGEGAKAGAIGIQAPVAQGSSIEDVLVEGRSGLACFGQIPGRSGGLFDSECKGATHGALLGSGTNPLLVNVKFSGQTGPVILTHSRTPTTLVGLEIKHNISKSPVFASDVGASHFRSGAGSLIVVDTRIDLSGAQNYPVIDNSLGRILHLLNVYVRGGDRFEPFVDSEGERVDLLSASWNRMVEYVYTHKDGQSDPVPLSDTNPLKVGYASNEAYRLIDGEALTKSTYHTLDLRAPPASLRTRHELANDPWFMDAGVFNTLTDGCISNRGNYDATADLQAALDAKPKVYVPRGIYFVSDTLSLGAQQTLFSHNLSYTRILVHPEWTNPEQVAVFTTANDVEATTRLEGFRIYRYGTRFDGVRRHAYWDWRAGRKSVIARMQSEIYRGADNDGGHAIAAHVWRDNGGGRMHVSYFVQDSKTDHPDFYGYLVEGTTEPLTFVSFNPEHYDSPNPFLTVRNAQNFRYFGQKVECRRQFVSVEASSNVGLFGHGVGCRPESPNGVEVISLSGNSDNVLASAIAPTQFHPNAKILVERRNGISFEVPAGRSVSLFKRGAFDNDAFQHQ